MPRLPHTTTVPTLLATLATTLAATLLPAAGTALGQAPAVSATPPGPSEATATVTPETIATLAKLRGELRRIRDEVALLKATRVPDSDPRWSQIREEQDRILAQSAAIGDHRSVVDRVPYPSQVPDRPLGRRQGAQGLSPRDEAAGVIEAGAMAKLALLGSGAKITTNATLASFDIAGTRWEVEEAKAVLAREADGAIRRLQELWAESETKAHLEEAEAAAARESQLRSRTVNIDWKGGTLADLVKAVQAKLPCNVVLGDAATALAIPPLSVQLVRPEVFFKSLQLLPLEGGSRLAVEVVVNDESGESTLPVVVIHSIAPLAPDMKQRVFELSAERTANMARVNALIQTIDFALRADGRAEQVKVRYHEPSKLLFVKAPADAMDLIGELIQITPVQ